MPDIPDEAVAIRAGCTAADIHLICNYPLCSCKQVPAAIRAALAAGRADDQSGMMSIPDDPVVWLIFYDDTDRSPEVFSGSGATLAAHRRFEAVKVSWNCHLFVRVADG